MIENQFWANKGPDLYAIVMFNCCILVVSYCRIIVIEIVYDYVPLLGTYLMYGAIFEESYWLTGYFTCMYVMNCGSG